MCDRQRQAEGEEPNSLSAHCELMKFDNTLALPHGEREWELLSDCGTALPGDIN